MTRSETIAYNRGVAAVMQLAERSADAMQAKLVDKPTRFNFAVEALRAMSDASLELLIPVEGEIVQGTRMAAE